MLVLVLAATIHDEEGHHGATSTSSHHCPTGSEVSIYGPRLEDTMSFGSPRSTKRPSSSLCHRTRDPDPPKRFRFALDGTSPDAHHGAIRVAAARQKNPEQHPRATSGLRRHCRPAPIRVWATATRCYRPCCAASAPNYQVHTGYPCRKNLAPPQSTPEQIPEVDVCRNIVHPKRSLERTSGQGGLASIPG